MSPTNPAETAGGRPGIRLRDVVKTYDGAGNTVPALARTSLDVRHGELLVLLGPSGCGKTTLLRMVGGLIAPSEGQIEVAGQPLWRAQVRNQEAVRKLGIVFQEPNLFPWLTIEDNVALPLEIQGVKRAERLARAHDLLRLVGINGFEKRRPRELSGGMRQRAAIARALAGHPEILLLDEPFGALDAMTREQMNVELQRIWMETGQTIVLVTHSIHEAAFLADRIVLLSPRPGRIDRIVDVPFARPRNVEVEASAEFQSIVLSLRQRLGAIS
jgi:NitT/TauT family transport system ATP-binding protein